MRLTDSEFRQQRIEVSKSLARYDLRLPDKDEAEKALLKRRGLSVRDVLAATGPMRIQPRCGVNDHRRMLPSERVAPC